MNIPNFPKGSNISEERHTLFLKISATGLVLFILYVISNIFLNGFVPPPFFYNQNDHGMDFFNINWMAHQEDVYSVRKVFYSPLMLWLGKLMTPEGCVDLPNAFATRSCAIQVSLFQWSAFLSAAFGALWLVLRGSKNSIWWWLLFILSFPMLYGIERGNYIVLALPLLVWYVLSLGLPGRLLPLSLLPLFKYYLGILFIPYLLKASWKFKIYLVFFFILFNLLGAWLYGNSDWINIPSNLLNFSGGVSNFLEAAWGPTTFSAFKFIANLYGAPYWISICLQWLSVIVRIWVICRLVIYLIDIDKLLLDEAYLSLVLFIALLVLSPSPGMYSIILAFPFIAYGLRNSFFTVKEKALIVLMCLPFPIPVFEAMYFEVPEMSEKFRWISLQLQSFALPIILLVLFYELTKKSVEIANEASSPRN